MIGQARLAKFETTGVFNIETELIEGHTYVGGVIGASNIQSMLNNLNVVNKVLKKHKDYKNDQFVDDVYNGMFSFYTGIIGGVVGGVVRGENNGIVCEIYLNDIVVHSDEITSNMWGGGILGNSDGSVKIEGVHSEVLSMDVNGGFRGYPQQNAGVVGRMSNMSDTADLSLKNVSVYIKFKTNNSVSSGVVSSVSEDKSKYENVVAVSSGSSYGVCSSVNNRDDNVKNLYFKIITNANGTAFSSGNYGSHIVDTNSVVGMLGGKWTTVEVDGGKWPKYDPFRDPYKN